MIKVAIILEYDFFTLDEGTRVYREAKALIKEGYEVTVFCWAKELDKYENKWERERENIQIIRIFENLKTGVFSKNKSFKNAMKQIVKKVQEYMPDIIHVSNLEIMDYAILINKFTNSKLIFDMHENLLPLKRTQNWFIRNLYNRKQKRALKNADAILTTCDELALDIEKNTVLFDSESIDNIEKPVENHRFGLNGIVAGYIGALDASVLEKIIETASQISAISLLIVGGPSEHEGGYNEMVSELEELATEKGANAKFTGPLPYSMMNECHAACDIMMVSDDVDEILKNYTIPSKLLYSMGYKIPVIVEPYEARKRIVERYNCGIASDDWIYSLTKLANDRNLRKEMGENGFKAFKMNYTWEAQEEKLLNVCKKLSEKNE